MSLLGDYNDLYALADRLAPEYRANHPFPHIVLDDVFPESTLQSALDDFPRPDADVSWRRIHKKEGDTDRQVHKLGLACEQQWPASIQSLIREFNSPAFLNFLQRLTGISSLIADSTFRGGGLHQILPGGLLGVHADFTYHRDLGLDRRLNMLVFLNKDWQDDFGGHLELWSRDATRCEKRLRPGFGRCVIFNTDADSFHGHPEPLRCPEGMTRKSIALYYYTKDREDKAVEHTFATDWQDLPEHEKPAPV